MSAAVLHLRSLGQLTADTQTPFGVLSRAVERLAIRPTVTIDGTPYYDLPAVAMITAEAARQRPAQAPAVAPRRVLRRDPAKDATNAPRGPRRPRSASQANPHDALSR